MLRGTRPRADSRASFKAKESKSKNIDLAIQYANNIEISLATVRDHHEQELAVKKCLIAVANAAGQSGLAPRGYDLDNWARTAPREYVQLLEHLRHRVAAHVEAAKIEAQSQELLRAKEYNQKLARFRNEIHARYQNYIDRFVEIAYRKVSLRDEYGDESWDSLQDEIDVVSEKILARGNNHLNELYIYMFGNADGFGGISDSPSMLSLLRLKPILKDVLKDTFSDYYSSRQNYQSADFKSMNGEEFEHYLIKKLGEAGCTNIYGTPKTGDQGGDILAIYSNRSLVIQAKRYGHPVGNKAVQEVHAAVQYYQRDAGLVIISSVFTPSARELAQRCDVILIEGAELTRLSEILKTSFS